MFNPTSILFGQIYHVIYWDPELPMKESCALVIEDENEEPILGGFSSYRQAKDLMDRLKDPGYNLAVIIFNHNHPSTQLIPESDNLSPFVVVSEAVWVARTTELLH